MPLNFLDNIFLLHSPFEPTQGILKGFPLLKPDFRQSENTPSLLWSKLRQPIIGVYWPKSRKICGVLLVTDRTQIE